MLLMKSAKKKKQSKQQLWAAVGCPVYSETTKVHFLRDFHALSNHFRMCFQSVDVGWLLIPWNDGSYVLHGLQDARGDHQDHELPMDLENPKVHYSTPDKTHFISNFLEINNNI